MTCPRCQAENPPRAKFCLECVAPLAARCANCGTPLPASAKFRLECAHPVGGVAASEPRSASPDAYAPEHPAEKILASRAALEEELKLVTVLFADLRGGTCALDGERAEIDYRHATTLASEIGLRPLLAHCHLGLGRLYRRTGEREPARDHLTTAMALYREMGMRWWVDQAEADTPS